MDYGDIFVGTFRTLWHNKRLWLFAIVAQILPAISAILGVAFALSFARNLLQLITSSARGGGRPLPPNLGMQIGASWLGFACLALLLGLAAYIVHLIMRGAVINEASIAWAGALTDWRRGLRAGTARAPYIFLIDLLWWVPLTIIVAVLYGGGFGLWVAAIAGLGNNNQPDQGALIAATFCCLACCGILFAVLIALFRGIFAPLMYQSAVQGRRTAGQAAGEGWNLARAHMGPMFIFLLLVLVIYAVAYVLMQVAGYPLQLGWVSGWTDWVAGLQRGALPATPPQFNTPVVIAGAIVLALIGLVVYGFTDAFGLTMYAAVYRRLTGRHLVVGERDLQPPPHGGPTAASPQEPVAGEPEPQPGESAGEPAEPLIAPGVPEVEPPAEEPPVNA